MINIKWRYLYINLLLLGCILFMCSCQHKLPDDNITIGDIAFDAKKTDENKVFLKETNELVPYIVVTNKYGGDRTSTLLLREELLDELQYWGTYFESYAQSNIDNYLTTIFFPSLNPSLQEKIKSTNIICTSWHSIGIAGTELEKIQRKVFLLSAVELGYIPSGNNPLKEGKDLKYFDSKKGENNRITKRRIDTESGGAWWLRTRSTRIELAWCIRGKGFDSCVSIEAKMGVRPAFCIDSRTLVEKTIINEKEVFVLKEI